MTATITLDTPLDQVDYDNAAGIGEELISTTIAGDEWGEAWDHVIRSGGTVRDLRADLYASFWELDAGEMWARYVGDQTVAEWLALDGPTDEAGIAAVVADGPYRVHDPEAAARVAAKLAEFIASERDS